MGNKKQQLRLLFFIGAESGIECRDVGHSRNLQVFLAAPFGGNAAGRGGIRHLYHRSK